MTRAPDVMGSVRVGDGVARVMLAGELDAYGAAHVQALLAEALMSGAPSVVVDLALVSFCDAAGLGLLVGASNALGERGAQLSLTGVSTPLRRLLSIAGLTDALHVSPATTAEGQLAAGLGEAARLPLVRNVLDAALHLVVVMSHAVMGGADGVSITVPRSGRLCTVAASNDVVLQMDHDQYDTGQGPCLDAATQGELFSSTALASERRWPEFVPRARARGIESIMSTPLMSIGRPLGALNVYSRAANALASHEQQWAIEFAEQASRVLRAANSTVSADSMSAEIEEALQSRQTIALAQGIVMAREKLGPDSAHRFLTDISRRTSRPLLHICQDLVEQTAPVSSRDVDDTAVGRR